MTTMRYTLKVWTGLQKARIYVDGGALEVGDKLFIKPGTDVAGRPSWDASLEGNFASWSLKFHGRGTSQYEIGLSIAGEALAERGWERLSFLEILNKLNNGEEPKEPVNRSAPQAPREITDEEREEGADFDAFEALVAHTPKLPGESMDEYSARLNSLLA